MTVGGYISTIGHIGLLGWLAFGTTLGDVSDPVEVTPVTVISAQDFDILANNTPPDIPVIDEALQNPSLAPDTPELSSATDTTPDRRPMLGFDTPEPDVTPDQLPEPTVNPVDILTDIPEIRPEPLPSDDPVTIEPSTDPSRPANDRVATHPALPPPPDIDTGEVQRDATTPDPTATDPQPSDDPTAPEQADTQIVTQAEASDSVLTRSLRPVARPAEIANRADPAPIPFLSLDCGEAWAGSCSRFEHT